MSKIFRFKQFSVDQTNCGMKVNTDAALLGSIAQNDHPKSILEIGTGTGVIALMLAQRYNNALIDAVEIDKDASKTAQVNFTNSPFAETILLIRSSFQDHFLNVPAKKYDLIVSNPPYFINSLKSPNVSKDLAKHTDANFFRELVVGCSQHLTQKGRFFLILPLDTAELLKSFLSPDKGLIINNIIFIHSFPQSTPYRCILVLGLVESVTLTQKIVIYESQNVYSHEYRTLLKDYLTIF